MDEQQLNSELGEHLKRFADEFKKVADKTLTDVYVGLLPHALSDTKFNAELQAGDMVRDIIAGRFEWDGDYIVIGAREYSPRIRLAFTQSDYDSLRDAIIERMPKCPKDSKIEMLERQLKQAYERGL